MMAAHKAARIIEELFDPDALSIWSDNGEIADQPFEHVCVEIVPRHDGVPYKFAKFHDLPLQQPEVLMEQASRYKTLAGVQESTTPNA
jgi:diadenosine tetraphosphate (Ap4A) HIT family hydrolase